MRVGCARVSTDDQTLDLHRDALTRAKCRQIYEQHASRKICRTTNDLKSGSVELESLTENLETGSPTRKLVFHVFTALANLNET
jgi:DNA invertase Pin-like site-specific DNA recombinase